LTATPQLATSLPDARPASLVLRLTPDFALPFVQLARLDRPAGWQMLLAPCWQATALAGLALHRGPNLWHLVLFLIGAIAMRGAGCTYNDILDRKLDAQVERTRNRPLPSGRVTVRAAAAFLVAQALIGLAVLLCFNRFSIWLGIASLGLVAVYPLMKRVTSWPQAALGIAFLWGVLMGWSATFASLALAPILLYASAFAWTIGYDTIYALQDACDDAIVDRAPIRPAPQTRRRRVLCRDRGASAGRYRSGGRGRNCADRLARLLRAPQLAGVASRRRGPCGGAEALSLQPRRRTDPVRRDRAPRLIGLGVRSSVFKRSCRRRPSGSRP
jgi:4-hydroxybenzoate polyprenyltransferase